MKTMIFHIVKAISWVAIFWMIAALVIIGRIKRLMFISSANVNALRFLKPRAVSEIREQRLVLHPYSPTISSRPSSTLLL